MTVIIASETDEVVELSPKAYARVSHVELRAGLRLEKSVQTFPADSDKQMTNLPPVQPRPALSEPPAHSVKWTP
jgi:hypothetical protein